MPVCSMIKWALRRNHCGCLELSRTRCHFIFSTVGGESHCYSHFTGEEQRLTEVKPLSRVTQLESGELDLTPGSWGLRRPREKGFPMTVDAAGDDAWKGAWVSCPAQRSMPSAAASQRVELTANQAGSLEPSQLSGAQEVKRGYERCRAPIKNLRPPSNFRAFIFQ